MHPIERLRYVARASGVDHGVVVRETAGALAGLGFDPAGVVTACRRIIERHPTSGPLWWLAARVLTSGDPVREAWRCADEVDEDTTASQVAWALPDDATVCVLGWPQVAAEALPRRGDVQVLVVDVLGEGGGLVRRLRRSDVDAEEVPVHGLGAAVAASHLVLLEASSIGPQGVVAVAGSLAAASVAAQGETAIWVVGGVGRVLPARLHQALVDRLRASGEAWEADDDVVPASLLHWVAGPDGVVPYADAVAAPSCPAAEELLRPLRA